MPRRNDFDDALDRAPDAALVRAWISDAVQDALDRAESAVSDAPSAAEVAERLRRRRYGELALTAAGAGVPIARSALIRHARRRSSRKAVMVAVPVMMRAHPVTFAATIIGGAAIGGAAVALRRRARRADGDAEGGRAARATGPELARMDDDGGAMSSYVPSNADESRSASIA